MAEPNILVWQDTELTHGKLWRSENGTAVPKRLAVADDTLPADVAYRLAAEGCALLWQGDFHNARQLLQALARRCDRPPKVKRKVPEPTADMAQQFHRHRQIQSQRSRILGMLLIPLNADYTIPLRRAPDVVEACLEAYGPSPGQDSVVSLRELQSLIGAHEWRKKGVMVDVLGAAIHPHFGVFSPLRGEYIDLVATAKLPPVEIAFDIGTGSGVLAAVLAKRGLGQIIATDLDQRALDCAAANLTNLGLDKQVHLIRADMFPETKADLIVCNPPWVPARPSSPVESAIFDPDSRMLRAFLAGLAEHLKPGGQGWLIMSDFAEHLGLRSREALLGWIADGHLRVIERLDTRPKHGKVSDRDDPLHAARAQEVTSLWRLARG